jgi:hypothetical protein
MSRYHVQIQQQASPPLQLSAVEGLEKVLSPACQGHGFGQQTKLQVAPAQNSAPICRLYLLP